MYRPTKPFNLAIMLLQPTIQKINGKEVTTYPESGPVIKGAYTTFGGSESIVNGIYTIIDTGTLETWYIPEITSQTRIKFISGPSYSIEGSPENIEMRNQFMKLRLKKVGA